MRRDTQVPRTTERHVRDISGTQPVTVRRVRLPLESVRISGTSPNAIPGEQSKHDPREHPSEPSAAAAAVSGVSCDDPFRDSAEMSTSAHLSPQRFGFFQRMAGIPKVRLGKPRGGWKTQAEGNACIVLLCNYFLRSQRSGAGGSCLSADIWEVPGNQLKREAGDRPPGAGLAGGRGCPGTPLPELPLTCRTPLLRGLGVAGMKMFHGASFTSVRSGTFPSRQPVTRVGEADVLEGGPGVSIVFPWEG